MDTVCPPFPPHPPRAARRGQVRPCPFAPPSAIRGGCHVWWWRGGYPAARRLIERMPHLVLAGGVWRGRGRLSGLLMPFCAAVCHSAKTGAWGPALALLSRRRACCPHMRALLRARRARRLAPRPPRFIRGGKIPPGQPAKGAFWFSFCAICLSFSKLSCPGENECKALHGMCSLQIAFRSCAQRRGCEAMCRMTAEHADDPLNDHPNPTKHRACSAAVLDALCFFDDKYQACSAKR